MKKNGVFVPFLLFFFTLGSAWTPALAVTSNISVTVYIPQCADGLDNDGDSDIDYPSDAGCSSDLDNNEVDPVITQCSDSIDNDGDSKVDYPTDTGCSSASDNDESDAVSGGGGGGGGGGGPGFPNSGSVYFIGRAYPKSSVILLKDAQVAANTVAGPDAVFVISLTSLSAGNYNFSLYSEDSEARRSSLLTFPVSVTAGAITNIGGIFIAPTISVDKEEVKRGDNITIFGQSAPSSDVTIQVNSEEEIFQKVKADTSGVYLYNLDSSVLEYGRHTAKSKSAVIGEISPFSAAVAFSVGNKTVLKTKEAKKGDVNGDKKVNLIDFSVAAYWYKRAKPPAAADLNGDGKVNLVDFSIMAYNWTG